MPSAPPITNIIVGKFCNQLFNFVEKFTDVKETPRSSKANIWGFFDMSL